MDYTCTCICSLNWTLFNILKVRDISMNHTKGFTEQEFLVVGTILIFNVCKKTSIS